MTLLAPRPSGPSDPPDLQGPGAIGRVAILSGDEELQRQLERARSMVGDLSDATDERDLRRRSWEVMEAIGEALELTRLDLMKRPQGRRR